RFCTSSPTRDDDNQPRRYNDDNDKEREKTRSRFLPINFTEKDFAMRPLLSERVKTNSSFLNDGDSMGLDQQISFDKVGGLDGHIESLKEIIILPLLYPELFSRFGIKASKGVLFHGPPGTGKTLVARALANAGSVNGRKIAFFMRKGADILSKWVGESEDQLRQLFEQAYQMRPAIIFFDEIDGLAPARSGKQDHIHTSIVSTLLALMDGLKNRGDVIVIGATNRIDAIDPALRRPGRFDRELKFSLPDRNARYAILKIHTASWKSNILDENLKWIADNTPGYCGADLEFLCTEAFLSALRTQFPQIYVSEKKLEINAEAVAVDRHHFESAMRRVVPACRRDFTVPTRNLNDRVGLLLKPTVEEIMKDCIPHGYRCSSSENQQAIEMEQVVRRFSVAHAVPPCRLLVSGKCESMGQTSYVLPVLLNNLGHLSIFSLSVAKLFRGGCMEETFTEAIQQAISSSSRGTPALLVIPSIDVWYRTVPLSLWQLVCFLSSLISTLILFLFEVLWFYCSTFQVQELFRPRQIREVEPPKEELKLQYFNQVIVEPSLKEPQVFDGRFFPLSVFFSGFFFLIFISFRSCHLSRNTHCCRNECLVLLFLKQSFPAEWPHLSNFFTVRFIRDRRFSYFEVAVDSEEVPDYYDVIKQPMDLSTMLDKANLYKSPEDFLADFALIRDNALEYNSYTDSEGRIIRQMAKALYHKGERAYHEIDSSFLRKLQVYYLLLRYLCFLIVVVKIGLTFSLHCNFVGNRESSSLIGYMFCCRINLLISYSKKGIFFSCNEAIDLATEEASGEDAENVSDDVQRKDKAEQDVSPVNITSCSYWELELLASELSAAVDRFSDKWNREELPNVLTAIINIWDFDAESSSREDED
ncbi:unnamed protein product, partial [Enterobius vermicularis]|uniref:Bromo domain-containing protein n=1 Tax=Enterobius vermicularis TaxID=51028 RepID=A0A0N4VFM4_ENTVE